MRAASRFHHPKPALTPSMRIPHPFSVLVLTSLATAQGVAVSDTFDRPNSPDLGPDWVIAEPQIGPARIQSNRLLANNGLFGWAMHTRYQAAYADTVVRFDFDMNGVGYVVSAIAGASLTPTNWEGIEARLCACRGGDLVTSISFHSQPNAGWWPTPGSCCPVSYSLATPISAGTLTLYFEDGGDTAVATVSSPQGGTEVFRAGGILSWELMPGVPFPPPSGLSVGIGYEGAVTVDDFRAFTGSPTQSPVYAMNPPRAGSKATWLITDATPNGIVGLYYSVTGASPIPTAFGTLYLTPPIYELGVLPTDANGRAEASLPNVSPALTGLVLHNQAFDGPTQQLGNPFTVQFQ